MKTYILFIFTIAFSFFANANTPRDLTKAEKAMLPTFCAYTQGGGLGGSYESPSEGAKRWLNVMGPTFWHMHHYCWALTHHARGIRATLNQAAKTEELVLARDDFLYVIRNSPDDFILLPEVLTWMGRNAIQLRNIKEANEAFLRAREIKPDYWPAFFHWALYLSSLERKAEALELLRQGLSHSPESKTLNTLYKDLGGKFKDVKPQNKSHELPINK
jgi:tetratricopeptide (TPR) repeat protein